MRGGKYMTSNNPVKGSWLDVVFIHMTSNNPVKGSWLDVVFIYMTYYKYFVLYGKI